MSTFAGWSSALIPLGDSIAQAQGVIVAAMQAGNWQCLRQGLAPTAVGGSITSPANALDMTPTTAAGQAGTTPQTIAVQVIGGFTPTALYMQAHYNYEGGIQIDMPASVTIEYSDTSLTTGFTVLQTFTPTNWGVQERRKFTIPPVTEVIGNSVARDILRINFNATTMTLQPLQELLTAMPMVFSFDTAASGVATLSVTNGTTVSFTGGGGNTSQQNARGLYNALASIGGGCWRGADHRSPEDSWLPGGDDPRQYHHSTARELRTGSRGSRMWFLGSGFRDHRPHQRVHLLSPGV